MINNVVNNQFSILIIDRSEIVHLALNHLIKENFKKVSFDSAYNVFEAVKKVNIKIYDLIIVEYNPISREGEILYNALKNFKKTKVLVFTPYEEKIRKELLISLNIKGYLVKSADTKQIILALTNILNGKRHFTNILGRYTQEDTNSENHRIFPLTLRETQILKLLVSGEKSKRIADLLGIHPSTMGTHKSRILAKFDVPNIIKLKEYIEEHHPELL